MKRFIRFCLGFPGIVYALAVGVMAAAFFVVRGLPVDVLPELKVPRVVIQTEAGGLTAEEVEQRVSVPVESAMNGIPGVRQVRSSSSGGLSFVWVDFDWNADIAQSRFAVFERLGRIRAALPSNVEAEISPVVSLAGEIMLVALTADGTNTSPLVMRQLAEFDLRNRLLAISGIGQVVTIGGNLPEVRVSVDPAHLVPYGLSVEDILASASGSRTWASAGYLPSVRGKEIPVRQVARADTVEAIRTAWLPTPSGAPVRLGDVVDVSLAGAPCRGSASFNGRSAVVLSVQKAPGGNTLALTRAVDAALDAFAKSRLPAGVSLARDAYRQADFINLSIANGREIVLGAALIVVLVLGLTLFRVRTVLITVLTIPLSVAGGVLFFPLFGLGVNIMTLGGLAVAVGDIVDCAIIVVEVAWRRMTENLLLPEGRRQPVRDVVFAACAEVAPSVISSSAIIVLVFLPLLFLSGIEGQFFKPLALSYLFVFAVSVLLAVTVTPVLCLVLGPRHPPRPAASGRAAAEALPVRLLKRAYAPPLRVCLAWPRTVIAVSLAAFAGSVVLALTFGTSFLPPFHEDCYQVSLSAPPGTSLAETERVTDRAAAVIARLPGVKSVTRRTGRAEKDEHAEPVSASELMVRVDIAADAAKLRRRLEAVVRGVPGFSSLVGYPMAHRISAVLSGTSAELTIDIFGEDLATLRSVVAKVKKELDRMPEVADARANREVLVDTFRIDYRPDRLALAGLTLAAAGEQVGVVLNGKVAGEIVEGLRRTDVVVRLAGYEVADLEAVKGLLLRGATGRYVRLDEVATVRREPASNLIVHENARRKAVISCNVAPGSSAGQLVAALRRRVEPVVHAAGCTVSYGGSYQAQRSAQLRLALLGGFLLVVVAVILVVSLKSFPLALLVMMNVPLCLLGGVAAVACTTSILSVASLVGFVTVIGFVIRNGLLLVHRYQELRAHGHPAEEAVRLGSAERMVPIVMTSLTTILGLLPIVVAYDKPGGELLAPLAVVQFGGLVSATLLNFFVLPALYLLAFGRRREQA